MLQVRRDIINSSSLVTHYLTQPMRRVQGSIAMDDVEGLSDRDSPSLWWSEWIRTVSGRNKVKGKWCADTFSVCLYVKRRDFSCHPEKLDVTPLRLDPEEIQSLRRRSSTFIVSGPCRGLRLIVGL